MANNELTYEFLDDLALAAARGRGNPEAHLRSRQARRIGPLLELLALHRSATLPMEALPRSETGQVLARATSVTQSGQGHHVSGATHVGFVLTNRNPEAEDQARWIAFCRKAQEAAELSLPKPVAQGLIGAMREIEENVHLHSDRAFDGIVGYRGTAADFEFAVADGGIGLLNSLRKSPDYAQVSDAGSAIKTALADGQSRLLHTNSARGYGFHDLFVGLANLNGELRFRSGDHALTIDGTSPSLVTARLSQKAEISGFLASVVCNLRRPQALH